jgi:integrating conjugative element membrane protein (TIGR03745 family)
MKSLFLTTRRTGAALRSMGSALLALVLGALASPAMAALPEIQLPAGATAGDPISILRYVAAGAIAVFALVVGAISFVKVGGGALTKFQAYRDGRADVGDLKEYLFMGVLLLVFIVLMLSIAITIIPE